MPVGPYDGFEALYEVEYPAMFKLAYLMTGDVAEAKDLTQEAFARLLADWDKVKDFDRPGAWTRRVVIRLSSRSRTRAGTLAPDRGDRAAPDHADSASTSGDVVTAIRSLPPKQRAAIVATYWLGCSNAETAAMIGCREPTVRVHLHRARSALASTLGMEG
jgi:RNA polymerase sigma factor (sigma-70 family)